MFLRLSLFLLAAADRAASPGTPPEVKVIAVTQRDVPIVSEWVATLDGYVNAQIQPQVTGYIVKQTYKEGSPVHNGAVLFEIDPRPFQALLDQAKAQLAQAQAQLGKTQLDVDRDTPLAKERAIAQSQLDNDIQANLAAKAEVQSAEAQVEQAQLNLGFTHVTSLFEGIAGIAQVQLGNLVNPSTVLTSVSQVNPIKAYFPISEQEYLRLASGINAPQGDLESAKDSPPLELILADGTVYPSKGRVLYTDRQVDITTGTIRVVSAFSNPKNYLRPGQFGRVRASTYTRNGALARAAAGRHRTAGQLSTGSRWQRQQGQRSHRQSRRTCRHGMDHRQWREKRRHGRRRRRSESAGRSLRQSRATGRRRGSGLIHVKIFHQPTDRRHRDLDRHGHCWRDHHSHVFRFALFPNIVPPEVQVLATYVGADADTIEQSVATPIEQQMSGVDNMNYMYSLNSTADGGMRLIVDLRRENRSEYRFDSYARCAPSKPHRSCRLT